MENKDILYSELANIDENNQCFDAINRYLNSNDEGVPTVGTVKAFMNKTKFKDMPFDLQRKLMIMFDYRQTVSSSVLEKEINLYLDMISDKKCNLENFAEYIKFIEYIYNDDVTKMTNDRLFVLINSVKLKKNSKVKKSEAMQNFEKNLGALYERNIDLMSNERLAALIKYVADFDYKDLPAEMKTFVKELFKRCAVNAETRDNNRNMLQTRYWFGRDRYQISNYFSQFNKGFFGLDMYDNNYFDKPAKNLPYKYMVKYADVQYAFMNNMIALSKKYHMSIPDLFESSPGYVHRMATKIAENENVPRFPDFNTENLNYTANTNPATIFYLREQREYKKKILPKMSKCFASMVKYYAQETGRANDCVLMGQQLHEFVCTRRMNNDLLKILATYKDNPDFEQAFDKIGGWLVNLVHLDELTGQSTKEIIGRPEEYLKKCGSKVATQNEQNQPKIPENAQKTKSDFKEDFEAFGFGSDPEETVNQMKKEKEAQKAAESKKKEEKENEGWVQLRLF